MANPQARPWSSLLVTDPSDYAQRLAVGLRPRDPADLLYHFSNNPTKFVVYFSKSTLFLYLPSFVKEG